MVNAVTKLLPSFFRYSSPNHMHLYLHWKSIVDLYHEYLMGCRGLHIRDHRATLILNILNKIWFI